MKKLQFVKIKCQCGHTNLVPALKTFRVCETLKCENCGKVIAEPKELIRIEVTKNSKNIKN